MHHGPIRCGRRSQPRRPDAARLFERSAWLAIVASSPELAALVADGAILVEDLAPDEAARIGARS